MRGDVVQRHVQRALVVQFFTEHARLLVKVQAKFIVSESGMGQPQAIENQRGSSSISDLSTKCETFFIILDTQLEASLYVVSSGYPVQSTRLFLLIAGCFENRQTLL